MAGDTIAVTNQLATAGSVAEVRLTRPHRLGTLVFGIALLATGIVGSAKEWPGVSLAALILSGALAIAAAIGGAFPGIDIKNAQVQWPDPALRDEIDGLHEELGRIAGAFVTHETFAEALDGLRHQLGPRIGELESSKSEMTAHLAKLASLLDDVILAHEPPPDDDMDDDDRLAEMERSENEISSELSWADYTGDRYRDGLRPEWLTDIQQAISHEEARQAAVKRFPHMGIRK